MRRTVRLFTSVAVLFGAALAPLTEGQSVPAGATVSAVERRVPFHGTFKVTATWGRPTGINHASPAIDFQMPIGTPVYASAAGSVDFVSTDPRNCNPLTHIPPGGTYSDAIQWCIQQGMTGTRIRIRHVDGTFSMYVHLRNIRPGIASSPPTRVALGELIGYSGNSGIATGPHLHYSKINAAGTATIDPVLLVACWGPTRHNYTNLSALAGTTVRNDNTSCN